MTHTVNKTKYLDVNVKISKRHKKSHFVVLLNIMVIAVKYHTHVCKNTMHKNN